MTALLDVKDLSVSFRQDGALTHAVKGVSFHVERGETVALVGESGSGKSVSMLALMGLLPWTATVTADELSFNGQNLLTMDARARRKIVGNDLAMIFQEPMSSLNPCFTVGWQIREALRVHLGMGRRERQARAIELFEQVGIPDPEKRLAAFPHQMSGGMNQRVMIAMAIACKPKLLIADEPTTALDVTIQAQILELVKELRQKLGMAIVWITHDLGVIAGIADRVMVMYGGQVVEEAPVRELFANPRHPYTRMLLDAVPDLAMKGREKREVLGEAPSPINPPSGCAFHPRCPLAMDRCRRETPELIDNVACHADASESQV